MRISRLLTLGILAVLLSVSGARADNATPQSSTNNMGAPRNFGTFFCPQKFDCSIDDAGHLAAQAGGCLTRGFGIQSSGVFDNASLDASNCLTGQLPPTGNGEHPLTPVCCVLPSESQCIMSCQLLMY